MVLSFDCGINCRFAGLDKRRCHIKRDSKRLRAAGHVPRLPQSGRKRCTYDINATKRCPHREKCRPSVETSLRRIRVVSAGARDCGCDGR